ncbi:MAG: helix-turn-helix domain-containing protein, partial [Candidatus Aenigmarchaeota archaeon]|nr:helix-turn-helix domain-containing protein [Candidatus Aenigmarchaeota archaeon]
MFAGRGRNRTGRIFRTIRRTYGLSQTEVGKRVGISCNYTYMIERGIHLPSLKVLYRFSGQFGFNYNLLRILLMKDKIDQFTKETRTRLKMDDFL